MIKIHEEKNESPLFSFQNNNSDRNVKCFTTFDEDICCSFAVEDLEFALVRCFLTLST